MTSGRASPESLDALDAEYQRRRDETKRVLEAVVQANEPTVLEEESFRLLMSLPPRPFADHEAEERFPVEDWAQAPLPEHRSEVEALSIRKGSLTAEERLEIESHVQHTYEFLQEDPLDRRVPEDPRDRLGPPREAGRVGLPARAHARRRSRSSRA